MKEKRWDYFWITGYFENGVTHETRVSRNVSPGEVYQNFKGNRDIPYEAFEEALRLMINEDCACLVISMSSDFSSFRFEQLTKNVYRNNFSRYSEFWI